MTTGLAAISMGMLSPILALIRIFKGKDAAEDFFVKLIDGYGAIIGQI